MEIDLPNNWVPRDDQMPLWEYLENGGKRVVEVAHRRWGKDDVALHWTACSAQQRIGSYLHMLPMANQAKKAIWDAVNPRTMRRRIDDAFPDAIRESTRENDMFIRFKSGSSWQVVGSDNFAGLIGSSTVGVVFSEWSLADPEAWAQIRPILRENGGWAIFIYTPKGKNHGWTTLKFAEERPKEWFSQTLPISTTKLLSQSDLDEELAEYISQYGDDDGRAYFDQEYNCSFNAPLLGSYYGSYLGKARAEDRIGQFPYEPGTPVYTGWDLGRGDDTAIWFAQRKGIAVRIIDYYRNSGKLMDHYAKVLQDKPYVYAQEGGHILPHDGSNELMHAPDSLAIQLMKLGIKGVRVLKRDDVDTGIHAVRQILPICYFNEPTTSDGLAALEAYHREWDDKRKMFKDTPHHDWASHCADGFRTLALGLPEALNYTPPPEPKYIVVGGKTTVTMDDAWAEQKRQRSAGGGRI